MIPNGCYVYDGWLGECKEWHAPQWWEYANVASIGAVIALVVAAILIVIAAKWVTK